jgi:hypothetical protein
VQGLDVRDKSRKDVRDGTRLTSWSWSLLVADERCGIRLDSIAHQCICAMQRRRSESSHELVLESTRQRFV